MKLLGTRILHLFPACLLLTCFVVYSIFLIETVETAFTGADLYHWFAADFGNYTNLNTLFTPFSELQISSSVVSLIVRLFFAYRILVLYKKRSRWLCIIICLVVFSFPQKSQRMASLFFSQFSLVGAFGDLAAGFMVRPLRFTSTDVPIAAELQIL